MLINLSIIAVTLYLKQIKSHTASIRGILEIKIPRIPRIKC